MHYLRCGLVAVVFLIVSGAHNQGDTVFQPRLPISCRFVCYLVNKGLNPTIAVNAHAH